MLRVSPDEKTITALLLRLLKHIFWNAMTKHKIADANPLYDGLKSTIPRLQKHVAYFDAAQPLYLIQVYINYKGAAFGWASIPSQLSILS